MDTAPDTLTDGNNVEESVCRGSAERCVGGTITTDKGDGSLAVEGSHTVKDNSGRVRALFRRLTSGSRKDDAGDPVVSSAGGSTVPNAADKQTSKLKLKKHVTALLWLQPDNPFDIRWV